MRRFILTIALLPLLLLLSCSGKEERRSGIFLDQLQPRDSVLIGDQLSYGFALNDIGADAELVLPSWEGELVPGVEIVKPWRVDTLGLRKGRKGKPARLDLEASVVLTSFEEGLYELPPVSARLRYPDGVVDSRDFESLFLDVKTMPVDTASFVVHEIKGQIRYPLTFRELLPWLSGGLAFSALVAGLVVLLVYMVRRRRGKGGESSEPAHIVALRKLDALRGQEHWAPERQKQFWSSVTDILREYIASRYGVPAPEMTSREIMEALCSLNVEESLREGLGRLFGTADYVKFAKHTAPSEDNASAVPMAVRFVTETYREEIEQEKKEA